MPDESQDKPKIIVDDDWKAQAQAEKERLSEQTHSADAGSKAAPADRPQDAPRELPPANFGVLVSSLVTQIFFALGAIQDPQAGEARVDLDLAKHHIDMLAVLEDKTKGNLSDEEKNMLDRGIYEARMQYVQVSQHLSM